MGATSKPGEFELTGGYAETGAISKGNFPEIFGLRAVRLAIDWGAGGREAG
jgi:hypothetical protein